MSCLVVAEARIAYNVVQAEYLASYYTLIVTNMALQMATIATIKISPLGNHVNDAILKRYTKHSSL